VEFSLSCVYANAAESG